MPPALPKLHVPTTNIVSTGSTIDVAAGQDLQAALDKATPGDTISLQAGAVYTGPFVLPAKQGTGWITIQSSSLGSALPAGQRVSPTDSTDMPKLESASDEVLSVVAGAHNYRFIGIEIRPAAGKRIDNLILLDVNAVSLDTVPSYFIFDRCYIHGDPNVGTRRGIAMNSAYTAVINSYLSDFKRTGVDAQAINSWNGPGPFRLANNYFEASGEDVLFGGEDPSIQNLTPSDIEIVHNYFSKSLTWRVGDPSYAGTEWSIKNILELKNAQRVLIKGNLFEHNWVQSQNGFSILFTVRDQSGTAPWSTVRDVTFSDNVLRHAANGINILGYDDNYPSAQTQRILIRNNLFYDIGYSWSGGDLLQMLDGTLGVDFSHNTALQSNNVITADGRPNTDFIFDDNIVNHNHYGIIGNNTGTGNSTISRYFPDSDITSNVFIGGPPSEYPLGNYFPSAVKDVGFSNEAGENFRLAPSSRYKNKASDGTDIGADMNELCEALAGANPKLTSYVPTCSAGN